MQVQVQTSTTSATFMFVSVVVWPRSGLDRLNVGVYRSHRK